jgi:hypothetical protein
MSKYVQNVVSLPQEEPVKKKAAAKKAAEPKKASKKTKEK